MASDSLFLLRLFAISLTIIELALTVYVSHWSSANHYEDPYGDWGVNYSSPAPVNFLIFSSIWSLLVLFYNIFVHINTSHHGATHKYDTYTVLGLDAITTVFWLAGFIALAKLVGGFGTGGGSADHFVAAIEACVVFGAFLCAPFLVSFSFGLLKWWRARKGSTGKSMAVGTV